MWMRPNGVLRQISQFVFKTKLDIFDPVNIFSYDHFWGDRDISIYINTFAWPLANFKTLLLSTGTHYQQRTRCYVPYYNYQVDRTSKHHVTQAGNVQMDMGTQVPNVRPHRFDMLLYATRYFGCRRHVTMCFVLVRKSGHLRPQLHVICPLVSDTTA